MNWRLAFHQNQQLQNHLDYIHHNGCNTDRWWLQNQSCESTQKSQNIAIKVKVPNMNKVVKVYMILDEVKYQKYK